MTLFFQNGFRKIVGKSPAVSFRSVVEIAIIPYVLIALPLWGLGSDESPLREALVLGLIAIFGGKPILRNLRKNPQVWGPALVFGFAFLIVGLGHFAFTRELIPAFFSVQAIGSLGKTVCDERTVHALGGSLLALALIWNVAEIRRAQSL